MSNYVAKVCSINNTTTKETIRDYPPKNEDTAIMLLKGAISTISELCSISEEKVLGALIENNIIIDEIADELVSSMETKQS